MHIWTNWNLGTIIVLLLQKSIEHQLGTSVSDISLVVFYLWFIVVLGPAQTGIQPNLQVPLQQHPFGWVSVLTPFGSVSTEIRLEVRVVAVLVVAFLFISSKVARLNAVMRLLFSGQECKTHFILYQLYVLYIIIFQDHSIIGSVKLVSVRWPTNPKLSFHPNAAGG